MGKGTSGERPALTPEEKRKRQKKLRVGIAALCVSCAAVAGAGIGAAFTPCYTVEYQGSPIAYVDNKDDLDSALLRAETLASDLLDSDYDLEGAVTVKTAFVPRSSVSQPREATVSILEQLPELTRVYTLTVDGVSVGAVDKAETISRALERVKDSYRTAATVNIAIESDLEIEHPFQLRGEAVLTEDQLTEALLAASVRAFPYTTQAGDTMESVARQFGMDPERLEALNADLDLEIAATDTDIATMDEILGSTAVAPVSQAEDPDALPEEESAGEIRSEDPDEVDPEVLAAQAVREAYAAVDAANALTEDEADLVLTEAPLNPGQTITVEQNCSLLVVSTVEEKVVDRSVAPDKLTLLDSTIPVGTQEVLVEGTPGSETVMTRVTTRCGVPVSTADLNSISRTRAEPLLVAVGYGSHPELYDFFGVGDILFQWPVQGTISSDYGYRYIFGGLNFHRGVDIPAPKGTAVHAAADGTVLFAGPKGSYGNLVIIDHGNGFQTLYGHNSGFLVKAGDHVTRGQSIAAVGSTGRSTGPHCHFEVHLNGELVDPLMYLPGDNNAPARLQVPLSELNQGEQEERTEAARKPASPAASGAGSEAEGEIKESAVIQTDEPAAPDSGGIPADVPADTPADIPANVPADTETSPAETGEPQAAPEAPAPEEPAAPAPEAPAELPAEE